jgi:hypothetical protein
MRSQSEQYDAVFLGGGFRGTTFLASNPGLFGKRICLVEQGAVLGAGLFREVSAVTNSAGADFFRRIDPNGPFGRIFNDPIHHGVTNTSQPVTTTALSETLMRLGSEIAVHLRHKSALLQQRALWIDLDRHPSAPVIIKLDNGNSLRSRICVLATGRQERLDRTLWPMRSKTWLSSKVLSHSLREILVQTLRALSDRTIVILGCSHSAFSAVELMLHLFLEIEKTDSFYRRPRVRIIQRGLVRLYYPSLERAMAEQIEGRERILDQRQDVCHRTGSVFRYSGLRHNARKLFCDIWCGAVDGVTIERAERFEECWGLIEEAGLVIQAIGYIGNIPELRNQGIVVRPRDSSIPLDTDEYGFASIEGANDRIAAIRVEPSSRRSQGGATESEDLYLRLGKRILERVVS